MWLHDSDNHGQDQHTYTHIYICLHMFISIHSHIHIASPSYIESNARWPTLQAALEWKWQCSWFISPVFSLGCHSKWMSPEMDLANRQDTKGTVKTCQYMTSIKIDIPIKIYIFNCKQMMGVQPTPFNSHVIISEDICFACRPYLIEPFVETKTSLDLLLSMTWH